MLRPGVRPTDKESNRFAKHFAVSALSISKRARLRGMIGFLLISCCPQGLINCTYCSKILTNLESADPSGKELTVGKSTC